MPTPEDPTGPNASSSMASVLATMHPLPSSPTPVPPAGFVPPPARDLLGSHPRVAEVAHAADVVEELEGFTDYDAVFGATVPGSKRIAGLLAVARAWRRHRDEAAAWNTYVRAQDALAWKAALDLLDELKPAYKLAVAQQPALLANYPRLAAFFDTHKNIAQRASVTKVSKKKAKAAAAAPVESTAEGASPGTPPNAR